MQPQTHITMINPQETHLLGLAGRMKSGKSTAARIIQFLTQKHHEISLEDMLNYHPFKQPQTTEWIIKNFAGKLKECISLITGTSLEDLERQEFKESIMPQEWNKNVLSPVTGDYISVPMTYREILQQFGTQGGRAIHPDFWVNSLFSDYKPTLAGESKATLHGFLTKPKQYNETVQMPKWVVSDVRFTNEVDAIEKHGGIVIKIFRNIDEIDQERGLAHNNTKHESETALDNYHFKYEINNNYDISTLVTNIETILKKENII